MKKILITGCSGGLGLDTAKKLLKKGEFVYATVHHEKEILDTQNELSQISSNFKVFKLDILDGNDLLQLDDVDIDVLINNAGIGDSGPLIEIDIDRYRKVYETNVFATLRVTQIVAKKFIKKGGGRIVFMGSMAGHIPNPFMAPYGDTKYATEGVVCTLRSELKPFNIKVVIINPGSYKTGFNRKNIAKKYEWMDFETSVYKNERKFIEKYEKRVTQLEMKSFDSITNKIVKAATTKCPRRRYYAPLFVWLILPILRLVG